MAASKPPAMVLPSWLPAMNRRSRCVSPASWNSRCFSYGRYVARRLMLRRLSSSRSSAVSANGNEAAKVGDEMSELVITQSVQRLVDHEFLGQQTGDDLHVAVGVLDPGPLDRLDAMRLEIVGQRFEKA